MSTTPAKNKAALEAVASIKSLLPRISKRDSPQVRLALQAIEAAIVEPVKAAPKVAAKAKE